MSPAKKPAKPPAARSRGTVPKASAGGARTGKSTVKKTTAKKTAGKSTAKASVSKTVKKAASTAKKTVSKAAGAAKKAVAKKTTAKKPVAKKTAAKKTVARKTAVKKTAAKKPVAKKTTAKKPVAKKTAAKKTPAPPKKTAAPKPPAKTSAPKKTTAKKAPAATRAPAARPAQPARAPRAAKLDAKQLAGIRERLVAEKAELERQQSELDAEGTQSEAMAEIGLDDDFADAGTATFDRERDLSIRNNITDLIDQVTRAVARIDDGTYGTCERCGRPIDAARLKALPHALLCLDCKRREERGR